MNTIQTQDISNMVEVVRQCTLLGMKFRVHEENGTWITHILGA
jgi:hypothetical protein